MCTVSLHLGIATKIQRSHLCGKLFLSNVLPFVVNRGSLGTLTQMPRNARRDFFFSNTCQKMRDGKHVKVKKR